MASKVKLTVSLDERLVKDLEEVSRQTHTARSRLVEDAPRGWRRGRLEERLKEGYQHMATEDRTAAERRLPAGWETMQ